MKAEYDNFIGIYKDVYSEGYCSHMISEFERLVSSGAGRNRQESEKALRHQKNDTQVFLNVKNHNVMAFDGKNVINLFFYGVQACFEDYVSKFSILGDSNIRATTMKMQRTDPGEGYHLWHGEAGKNYETRVLVYMLYLNTLDKESAGETEFLYQKKRFHPEENTMLIWPAAYTHAHRGNTVFGNKSKYIITGWFHYE